MGILCLVGPHMVTIYGSLSDPLVLDGGRYGPRCGKAGGLDLPYSVSSYISRLACIRPAGARHQGRNLWDAGRVDWSKDLGKNRRPAWRMIGHRLWDFGAFVPDAHQPSMVTVYGSLAVCWPSLSGLAHRLWVAESTAGSVFEFCALNRDSWIGWATSMGWVCCWRLVQG